MTFLAAISSFKQKVEALSDLHQWVELLIRLLCAVPGWSEKNVQVFKVSLLDNSVCLSLMNVFVEKGIVNVKH